MLDSWGRKATTVLMLSSVAACASAELPNPDTFPNAPNQPAPITLPDGGNGSGGEDGQDTNLKAFTPTGNKVYDNWREDFAQRAVDLGRSAKIVYSVLEGLRPMAEVETQRFGDNQPEFVKPIWDYVQSATSPARVSAGQEKLVSTDVVFDGIENDYATPREILTAVWGMETSYGKILGSFDAARQLATLGYEGRRTALGESNLLAMFELIERNIVSREQFKTASWAGAVGQTQFMPATYLAYGRDGDDDNRIDMWSSEADALASAANYLTRSGWKKNQPWALEVILPQGADYLLADGQKRSVDYWLSQGFQIANNRQAAGDLKAELFTPAGAQGPAFLLFDNFYAIRKYNNADSYALSIGLLADKLAGRPELSRAWPTDVQLPGRTQVMELQEGLQKLGYNAGPVDGLAGRITRAAVAQFQKDRDIFPADGFVTMDIVQKIKQAAG